MNVELLKAIASNLPGDWSPVEMEHASRFMWFQRTDGVCLRFYQPSYGSKQDRLFISGSLLHESSKWPINIKGEISVSDSHDPVDIARDIERRLMPGVEKLAESTRKSLDEDARRKAHLAKLVEELTAKNPNLRVARWSDGEPHLYYDPKAGYCREFHLNYSGTEVLMSLWAIPLEKAVKIMEILDS